MTRNESGSNDPVNQRVKGGKWKRLYNEQDRCIYVQVRAALYGHPLAQSCGMNL